MNGIARTPPSTGAPGLRAIGSSRARSETADAGGPPLVPMTDFAANVFTVFFLLLVAVLAAVASSGSATVEAPAPVHRRAPASSDQIVEALHDRQRRGPGAIVEVRSTGVRLIRPGGSSEVASGPGANAEISAAVADLVAAKERQPALVLVFAPGPFAAVQAGLRGRPYLDLAVPAALRRCAGSQPPRSIGPSAACAVTEDWTAGFLALEGRDLDRTAFRAELAALLSAGAGRSVATARTEEVSVAAPPSGASSASVWLLVALPLVTIAAIETTAVLRGRRRRSVRNVT